MNANVHRQLNRRKRRILRRIENKPGVERHRPMMAASNIHYQIADRVRAIAPVASGRFISWPRDSAWSGTSTRTSWGRTGEGCQVPRLFEKTRGFSSLSAPKCLGLRLVEA